ncbi:polyamine ABC transporter substrate-binding protein [Haloferax sp. DFSO52]|uniref:polyamine ABC transporter substrate-binding protein n=1 Tax=Haloferax sp. DFSO52 TaxID=3388505 RepID=UPI003A8A2BC8
MTRESAVGRRRILKYTGTLAATGLTGLAGCTGNSSNSGENTSESENTTTSGETTASETTATNEVREELGLQSLDYELEDSLNILQWAQYWPSDTVANFEKAYGVSVNVSNYASNEELYNKLKAGGTDQYDLIFPSDSMLTIMANQDMLKPIDTGKIPNWDNLLSNFQNPSYDPGSETYAAPYQWGTTGIGWNTDVIGDVEIDSWNAMWNSEFSGNITMLDSMRSSFGGALKRLGYSLNTTDEDKVEEAKQALIEQKSLLQAYDSSTYREKLENSSASPVQGWSGAVLRARENTMSSGESPVNYVVPKEGAPIWTDSGAVTSKAKHPNAAHAFINYFLNAKVGASISNLVRYASPNDAAKEYMDETLVQTAYPDQKTMDNLEYFEPLGKATQMYSEAWTEVKTA